MYYEINVSLNGKHFFATHKRSIQYESDLKKVLPVIVAKFPANEGFSIMVTKQEQTGYILDLNELINNL